MLIIVIIVFTLPGIHTVLVATSEIYGGEEECERWGIGGRKRGKGDIFD